MLLPSLDTDLIPKYEVLIPKTATCTPLDTTHDDDTDKILTFPQIGAILDMKSKGWNFYFWHVVSQGVYLAIASGLII